MVRASSSSFFENRLSLGLVEQSLQAIRHIVEVVSEKADLILRIDRHPRIHLAACDLRRTERQELDRARDA